MLQGLSFEVFPSNTTIGINKLFETLQTLQQLEPEFISVTCSNGTNNVADTTVKVARYIHQELNISTIAHLPATYLSKQEVDEVLYELDQLGIHQVLALRGDVLPQLTPKADFQYASELTSYIKEVAPQFQLSGACYPEIHPESSSRLTDIKHLKKKVEAGCDQLISQLFLDNDCFYQFQEACELADIEAPVIAGIMPIVNRNQALRLLKTTQTKLPRKFLAILEKYEHDPIALRDAGLAYAVDQIVDLVTQDVAGIHLYTMNDAKVAQHIVANTQSLFARKTVSLVQ
ncbi:methylenetetrahydrofolate reductase [NAD(P)H] [Enterococcus alcedinis]|uniref:Methylenetetrahydrofolate reductase n=1 Tax=Enterococcus alcedinis TaxID=1274384 RepID=A0A917JFZ3_9ENTE|nr:methylenetetrahydrofolate reductase [NAD(P)H] [Enterococcus alcedinis]MBP2102991.1 methylenetetrahydrofolate reductase (NADPH) [Enterococcus alcedinis]GGI66535.1 methylenetetrahydrofolate reductase [Enterococcus alcedinis]